MTATLVDAVLLDYLNEDADWFDWSAAMLGDAAETGTLAISRVFSHAETARTVITAFDEPDAREHAAKAGSAFLAKPFSGRVLLETVRSIRRASDPTAADRTTLIPETRRRTPGT